MITQRTWKWGFIALALALAPLQGRTQDQVMGEYEGTYQADRVHVTKAEAKVIAEGPGYYRVVLQAEPLASGAPTAQFVIYGVRQGREVRLFGRANADMWHGTIADGQLVADPGYYGVDVKLKKTSRTSPTLGEAPPPGAVVLLPFTSGTPPDTSAWTGGPWKPLSDGSLQCQPGKGSITTKERFGDIKLHLEFWLPLMADHFGQERANSGVFLNGLYEIQVLDSFGLVPAMGDCGSVYNQIRPLVNANLPPEHWQTYDITFHAPRMDPAGSLKEKARVTVLLNGIKVQDNSPIEGATMNYEPGKRADNAATGPLKLQDHGNRVRYRNVWLVQLKDGE